MEKSVIGLILILLMFFSTFAYAVIQRAFYQKEERETQVLPTERIITSISETQRILAISNGFTLIYFNYTSPTSEIKSYLESLANRHYIYLIENPSNEDFLKVESRLGSREIKDPNLNQTIDLLCRIMIDRPIDCVMREIE